MIMNTLQNYVNRLKSCGMHDAEALRMVKDFLKNFPIADLEDFVHSLEQERHVNDTALKSIQ